MHKTHMTGSVVWKVLCWLTLAGAVYLFSIGNVPLSIAIGALSILLFVIDFRVARIEAASGDDSPFNLVKKDFVFQIAVAIAIIVGAQIIMQWVYARSPGMEPPVICFLCKH